MANNKLDIPSNLFSVGKEVVSDIKKDISDTDSNINSDIIIETDDTVDRITIPILLRLKPSTITKLDDIAYKTRRSRNYVAQQLLDQAMANVKLK